MGAAGVSMIRYLALTAYGSFVVDDDPQGVIAAVLGIVVALDDMRATEEAIVPDGAGVSTQAVASVDRVRGRDELPEPFNEDPACDPDTQELWFLHREYDRTHRNTASTVLDGDELRALMRQAYALRTAMLRDER